MTFKGVKLPMRHAAPNESQFFFNNIMLRKSNLWNLLKGILQQACLIEAQTREKINNQAECNKRVKIEKTQEWNKKETGK